MKQRNPEISNAILFLWTFWHISRKLGFSLHYFLHFSGGDAIFDLRTIYTSIYMNQNGQKLITLIRNKCFVELGVPEITQK